MPFKAEGKSQKWLLVFERRNLCIKIGNGLVLLITGLGVVGILALVALFKPDALKDLLQAIQVAAKLIPAG